jgi:hypothetical protein
VDRTANLVNVARAHVLVQTLGTTPRDNGVAFRRSSVTHGLTTGDAWEAPVTRVTVSDALSLHLSRGDLKLGGEIALGTHTMDSHVFENGFFEFQTDADFNRDDRATWPMAFNQQTPAVTTYRSQEIGAFAQYDWRAGERVRLNTGVRYDLDLDLRLNDFYAQVLDDPRFTGLGRFISRDRGTDTNNLQPRLGLTWDSRGDGRLIVRAGWGLYVTRNRPWFQMRAMNQVASNVIRVTTASRLQNFDNVAAVLGGLDLASYIAAFGGRNLGTVIQDGFVQPYAMNSTAGFAWQIGRTSTVEVDYVHSYGNHQTGSTDVNLPTSGAISDTNPRPVPAFSQVMMLENFSRSWYGRARISMAGAAGRRRVVPGVLYAVAQLPRRSRFLPDAARHTANTARVRLQPVRPATQPHDRRDRDAGLEDSGERDPQTHQRIADQDPGRARDRYGSVIERRSAAVRRAMTVGRERVEESFFSINDYRAKLPLPPIERALLDLDPYRTLDLRLSRSWGIGGSRPPRSHDRRIQRDQHRQPSSADGSLRQHQQPDVPPTQKRARRTTDSVGREGGVLTHAYGGPP